MKDVIVKSNKLVEAIQTLTLSETRLVQLAIIDAREKGHGLSSQHPLELKAERYAKAFNVTLDASYSTLLEAEQNLFKRQFTITNDDGTFTKSRWIQDVNYQKGEGKILVTLTRVLIDHITRIDGFTQYFTQYHLEQTANFTSVYAIRLYELLAQWRTARHTPEFEINKFREQLGIGTNEYSRVEAFKRRVLEPALLQINEFSDLTAKYTQQKKGRSISGFSFTLKVTNKEKEPKDVTPSKQYKKMTESQRFLFAKKLAELSEMSKYSVGTESYDQFAVRIADMLKDEQKFVELYPYLVKVGYLTKSQSNLVM